MSTQAATQAQTAVRPVVPAQGSVRGFAVQRTCACGQHTSGGGECEECKRKRTGVLQRSAIGKDISNEAPASVQNVLLSQGTAMDAVLRAYMEPRFGHDFSNVRIHTDSRAAESVRAVNALAYTVGKDVVFGANQYQPETNAGRRLIAHELTHVLQQGQGQIGPQTKLAVGAANDAFEQEADRMAEQATSLASHSLPARPFGRINLNLQRACGPIAIGSPLGSNAQPPIFIPGYPAFRFNNDCDDFASGEEARLVSTAVAMAPTAQVEIHGYASTIGDSSFNQNLSAARALKAKTVLTNARPAGAGLAAAQISGVFHHGPTPGGAITRRVAVITPPRATPLPAAIPAAGATDFRISRVGTSTSSRLFFSQGSAVLDGPALTQVAALRATPPGTVRLIGYASADEAGALAQNRADAVRAALTAPAIPAIGPAPAQNPVSVTSAVGNAAATASRSGFTQVRSVEILVGAAAPATIDCAATDPITGALINPPRQPCATMDPPTWTAFNTALPIAQNAMSRAVTAVAGAPNATDAPVIDRFFGNHSAATLGHLRTNLGNLQTHVNNLPGTTSCGGQCDIGGCEKGPIAYNSDFDAASTMTLCVPVFKNLNANDAARNLIHESAHGTTPLGGAVAPTEGTKDLAYRHERMLFQLSPAERLRNSDSYALFALFLREIQTTSNPAAVPAGISTPANDSLVGFGADEPALRLALARLEKRISWAEDWTGQLYGEVNKVRTGVSTWAASWAESLMREAAARFPLTPPPAAPSLTDQTRVASIQERFLRMKFAVKTSLTVTRMANGEVRWPPSAPDWIPGANLQIGPDFFRATPDDQVDLLVQTLASATRDVEPAFVPAYVSLAAWIHGQNL